MPSYATGDNNLDAALVNLGSAMFPSAKDKLTAQYRAAAAGKAQAAAEKTRMEAKLLAEQHAQQSKLVPLLGDHLVQQNLGNEPGISTDIAGPAVPGLYAKEDFLRAAPGAVLAGGGNASQVASGLARLLGTGRLETGPVTEENQRLGASLLSLGGTTFGGTKAMTVEGQNELLAQAAVEDRAKQAEKLHNIPKNNRVVRQGYPSEVVAYGQGAAPGSGSGGGGGVSDLPGTGMPVVTLNNANSYNNALRNGEVPSAARTAQYEALMLNHYGAKPKDIKVYDEETKQYRWTTQMLPTPVPPMYHLTDNMRRAGLKHAGGGAPVTDLAAPGLADQTDQPTGVPAAATDSQGVRVAGPGPGGGKVGQEALRGGRLDASFVNGVNETFRVFRYNDKTRTLASGDQKGFRPGLAAHIARESDVVPEWLYNLGTGTDEQIYGALSFAVVEPMLRLRSGAATPDPEVARYFRNLIPRTQETEGMVLWKMQRLQIERDLAIKFGKMSGIDIAGLTDQPDEVQDAVAAQYREFRRSQGQRDYYLPPPEVGAGDVAGMDETTITQTLEAFLASGTKAPPDVMKAFTTQLNKLGVK